MNTKQSYRQARASMVRDHLCARDIINERVISAMSQVPREQFVQSDQRTVAYEDNPLSIGSGQTISQPYVVALMTQALKLQASDTVLEVGTGSGYAAAVLACLCEKVYTIECIDSLAQRASAVLARLGYNNIEVICADGSLGWPDASPYTGIVVTAGGPCVPETLKRQLAINGRLVIPVGSTQLQQSLLRVTRISETDYDTEDLGYVRFVPLIGAEGWSHTGHAAPRQVR